MSPPLAPVQATADEPDTATVNGTTYYFCSKGCRAEFEHPELV